MTSQFDELSKALAGDLSRREVLQRISSGLVGAALVYLGVGKAAAAPSPCAVYCSQAFPPGPARATCGQACRQCGADISRVCNTPTGSVCCGPEEACRFEGCVSVACTMERISVCPRAFYPCNRAGNCVCVANVEGSTSCADPGAQCLGACQTSAECVVAFGPGAFCTPTGTLAGCCGTDTPQCMLPCPDPISDSSTTTGSTGWRQ